MKLCQEREKSVESNVNPELDQLRIFLDEKDKHIKDLMDTLKNFHVMPSNTIIFISIIKSFKPAG